jgi:uncharacterized protein GlcG (DUF336 family)
MRIKTMNIPGTKIATLVAMACAHCAMAQAPAATAAYSQTGAPLAATATNQAPAPAAAGPALDVSLDAARAALKTCAGIDQKIGVTVVDSAGIPKVVLASDGASARGVQSSTNKALTALAFQAATSELGEKSGSDAHLREQLAGNPIYNPRAGGLLLKRGTTVLGAVGVGGAKGSEKDETCAKAALGVLEARSSPHQGGS